MEPAEWLVPGKSNLVFVGPPTAGALAVALVPSPPPCKGRRQRPLGLTKLFPQQQKTGPPFFSAHHGMEDICSDAISLLSTVAGKPMTCQLDTSYEKDKTYLALKHDAAAAANFRRSLGVDIATIMSSGTKDSLVTWLGRSARAKARFAEAVNCVVVKISPPSPAPPAKNNGCAVSLERASGTLVIVVALSVVLTNKVLPGLGPQVDELMGLCILSDDYVQKAQSQLASISSECASQLPMDVQVDWTFVDHENFAKLKEDARASTVAGVVTVVRTGLLDASGGLVRSLCKSQRAMGEFLKRVQSIAIVVDGNKTAALPFELKPSDGVLRIVFRIDALVAKPQGWAAAIDALFDFRIIDEEGMRQVHDVMRKLASTLPPSVSLDVDWSGLAVDDKWTRLKAEEKRATYASLALDALPKAVDALHKQFLAGTPWVKGAFCSRVRGIVVRPTMQLVASATLRSDGALIVPADASKPKVVPVWGPFVDTALDLRMDEVEAMRKIEADLGSICKGAAVTVDWLSFADEPTVLREKPVKRVARLNDFAAICTAGLTGIAGALNSLADAVTIRVANNIPGNATGRISMRVGESDRVLEVFIKTNALSSGSKEPWLALFQALHADKSCAVAVQRHSALKYCDDDNSGSAACEPLPLLDNPLLGSSESVVVAHPPKPVAPKTSVPTSAVTPVQVAPAPVVVTATAPPRPVAVAPSKAPPSVVVVVPAVSASPDSKSRLWPEMDAQFVDALKPLEPFGFRGTFHLDWSFAESGAFEALRDTQQKTLKTCVSRLCASLVEVMVKLCKLHSTYANATRQLKVIHFRYDCADTIHDPASGKQGQDHYRVALVADGETMMIECNFKNHTAGILPLLDTKLQIAWGQHHFVLASLLADTLAKMGASASMACELDSAFLSHPNFLQEPCNANVIFDWQTLFSNAEKAVQRIFEALATLRKDAIFNEAVVKRFSKLVVVPDPSASVRDAIAPSSYSIVEDTVNRAMVFRFNYANKDGLAAGTSANAKLVALVNVRVLQGIAIARKDVAEQLSSLCKSANHQSIKAEFVEPFGLDAFLSKKDDEALQVTAAVRPWLTSTIKQWTQALTKNPTLVAQRVRTVSFGLASSTRTNMDVSLDDGATLRIVQNLNTVAKPDAGLLVQLDSLLGLTLANATAKVVADLNKRGAALGSALGIAGMALGIEWATFEAHPTFSSEMPPAKEAKIKWMVLYLEKVEATLVKLGREACHGLVAVLLLVDMTNSIADRGAGRDAEWYTAFINRDGLLSITVNYKDCGQQIAQLPLKLGNQTLIHCARQSVFHNGAERYDWESLQCADLLNNLALDFAAVIAHCKATVVAWAAALESCRTTSPAGASALQPIRHFVVRMNATGSAAWEVLWENRGSADATLVLSLSLKSVRDKLPTDELAWKEAIEWCLGATVSVEKFHGQNRLQTASETLARSLGHSSCPVNLDWALYFEKPQFLELGADGARRAIRRVTTELLHALVDCGLVLIAKHPVGLQKLKQVLKSVNIVYGPNVDMSQRLQEPIKVVLTPQNVLQVTFNSIDEALQANYEARIQFELGIIVLVAEHEALSRRQAVSARCNGLPITWGVAFTQSDEFRFNVPIANQAKVIDAVVAGIAEHVVGRDTDSLASLWHAASGLVKSFHIDVDTGTLLSQVHGRLAFSPSTGQLCLTYELGAVLQFAQGAGWRARVAAAIGILDQVMQGEAHAKLAQTAGALAHLPVSIEWTTFSGNSAWRATPAAAKYEMAHNLGGEVSRILLLGYWGLSGLFEFEPVLSQIRSKVKCVTFQLRGTKDESYVVEHDAAASKLVIKLSLHELETQNLSSLVGCRERVEALFQLRPLLEQCAQKEVDARHCAPAAKALDKQAVEIDWSSFMNHDDYRDERDYVEYIRYVGTMVEPLLLGDEGLPWMCKSNPEAGRFFKPLKRVRIQVDGSCTARPPQQRCVNGNMSCTLNSNDTLVIRVRRDWMEAKVQTFGNSNPPDELQVHNGCGSVVAYLLAPGVCDASEANFVESYRAQLVQLEEQYRAREIDHWRVQCENAIESYNDDVRRYAQAGRENCSSCRGSGYNSFLRRQCSSCYGTGKRQATMTPPSMPINPPQPQFPSITSTDWMALALSETSFSSAHKATLRLAEHPDPSTPHFHEQPCPRWSRFKQLALGGEEAVPATLTLVALGGQSSYDAAPKPKLETKPAKKPLGKRFAKRRGEDEEENE